MDTSKFKDFYRYRVEVEGGREKKDQKEKEGRARGIFQFKTKEWESCRVAVAIFF